MAVKGKTNNPHGRKKGVPNKTTKQFKEALNSLLEESAPHMVDWLSQVEDPAKRFDIISKFVEFIYPKLARQELVGDEEKPVAVKDVTDIKAKLLKALPEDELNRILAGDNNG